MRVLGSILLVLIAAGCGCDDANLRPYRPCGSPCYDGPPNTNSVGACKPGIVVCLDDESDSTRCEGQVLPTREVSCDLIDNNCDGKLHSEEVDNDGDGFSTCQGDCDDRTKAVHPGAEEVCDGLDNDCDGEVDPEDKLPIRFCYEGPIGTGVNPPCHPGAYRCHFGTLVCENWRGPSEEVCDLVDNDCDGRIDEGLDGKPYDFLFVVDLSCSMGSVVSNVKTALSKHVADAPSNTRYGLVLSPPSELEYDGRIMLATNMVGSEEFMKFAGDLRVSASGTAEEYTYDALMAVARDEPIDRRYYWGSERIAWRNDAHRIVVLIGDEPGMTAQGKANTEDDVAAALRSTSLFVYVFNRTEFQNSYDAFATPPTGTFLDVYGDIEATLNNVVLRTCEP